MNITFGRIKSAQKVVIYGPEGIGKSTFASRFPEPVFIDTEGSTKHMDVARLPNPETWDYLLEEVNYILQNPTIFKTLVIDTADWAEALCIKNICSNSRKKGIEDFGYGKGYVYVAESFQKLLDVLDKVIDAGVHVVITAHAKMRKFEQPDEMGAYDRWEMKLSKNTAPLLKEWADAVLFANFKTFAVKTDDKGSKYKGQGGQRTMYTVHHPCWDAKNRWGLPDEVSFTYESIRQHIEGLPPIEKSVSTVSQPINPVPSFTSEPSQVSFAQLENIEQKREQAKEILEHNEKEQEEQKISTVDIPAGIPDELAALMRENNVNECEIQMVVSDKGYYPLDTPMSTYDPDFVHGCLIGAWEQVLNCVMENRKNIPF